MTDLVLERIPQAYIYARISDRRGAERGDSIPGQIERCMTYYTTRLKPIGVGFAKEEYDSYGVSASKIDFMCRPAGINLMNNARQGDHIIFDKPDRAFRSPADFYRILEIFNSRGVHMHFVFPDIDIYGPMGQVLISILMAFAKMESDMNSRRVSDAIAIRRKQGRAIGSKPPLGVKVVIRGSKQHRYWAWHQQQRQIMARIVELRRDDPFKSFDRISWEIEAELAAKSGRAFKKSEFYKRFWTKQRCREAFMVEVYYRDHGIEVVTDIPQGLLKKASEYARKLGLR